jgi:hypothetical protein
MTPLSPGELVYCEADICADSLGCHLCWHEQPIERAAPTTAFSIHLSQKLWTAFAARASVTTLQSSGVAGLRPGLRACIATGGGMVWRPVAKEADMMKDQSLHSKRSGTAKAATSKPALCQRAFPESQPHTVRAAISRLRKGGAKVLLDRRLRTPTCHFSSAEA